MDYINISSTKKPPQPDPDNKQLFSFDVTAKGAKNFFFYTYEQIYKTIKYNQHKNQNPNFYEDNTYSHAIKLFIDYDEKIIFNNQLERDKYAEKITERITSQVNYKIKNTFKIEKTPIIILMSDTLLKMSLHFVYPEVIFNNIYEMKYFMNDIDFIDQSVYRIGCFRMMFCSKMGKQNNLLYSNSINYIKPTKEYQLFLDCCICHTQDKTTLKFDIIDQIKITTNNKYTSTSTSTSTCSSQNIVSRNYSYRNVDFEIIKSTLDKLAVNHSDTYEKWLTVSFCLKELYLGLNHNQIDQEKVLELFDGFSKNSKSYHKQTNNQIFMKLDPILDINYLFKLSEEPHYILPFYNYREIIFNSLNHRNIIIRNERFIDINSEIERLVKYKYICLKSPTGTGKTTVLKQIIEKMAIHNVISITSRVNLAGEHTKNLNLSFYLDMKTPTDFETCERLVIQLESLKKCNYKLFKNSIVILDEVNSLLSHLRSPTMFNKRRETYLYLVELIRNASYVISMDCDLSDWNITFLQEIENTNTNTPPDDNYIVYYNTVKNKLGTTAVIYNCSQTMVDIMLQHIKTGKHFIACFDSLKQMNLIIDFLNTSIKEYYKKNVDETNGNTKKENWLIYSSEVDYQLIDTKTWIDKFVFFTPTIIYGIDYSYKKVDVFSFTQKTHLNPLQIYQMLSRGRDQGTLHIYCSERPGYLKYKNIQDVIRETELYETNFASIMPTYKDYIDIDDKPYRTMFYNYKFMDSVLKTNIKGYLIDILIEKGYDVTYENHFTQYKLVKPPVSAKTIKERICDMLSLDKDNLSDLENKLVTDDKALEKHFNLRLLLNDTIDDKLVESITKNLFIETLKNKNTKIKICKELMNLLEIDNLESLNKNVTNNFTKTLDSEWLMNYIVTIKKTFDIRGVKYDDFTYYNIYLLLITLLKSLFDTNLFIRKEKQIKKIKYVFYKIDDIIYQEHKTLIKKFDNNFDNIDFI
jgi:hypothetical protein